MSISYANPTSGPSAGGIGWIDFGALNLTPGQTATGITGTLNDGTTITFDVTLKPSDPAPAPISRNIFAAPSPSWPLAAFGTQGYTGIAGDPILKTSFVFQPTHTVFTLSNIVVKDSNNNPVPNYTMIATNSESTNPSESWIFNTNGWDTEIHVKTGSIFSKHIDITGFHVLLF